MVVVGSNGTTIDVAIRDYGFMAPTEAIGTMTVAQTAAYEAPELLRGETSEAGAEQALAFALGSALFHLISGVPAWHGHNAMATASRIVAGERPELLPRSSIASSIPTAVTDLVTALWQDNPTARPKLVDAMTTLGEALDRILPRSARSAHPILPHPPELQPTANFGPAGSSSCGQTISAGLPSLGSFRSDTSPMDGGGVGSSQARNSVQPASPALAPVATPPC